MAVLKLSYFDFNGGRGDAPRLAFAAGGIEFEDHRIPLSEWGAQKAKMPLHAIPVLVVDGEEITQSNAILRYAGRLGGLYPEDPLDALRCDEVLDAVEDVVSQMVQTFGIPDATELKAAREALVKGSFTLYLSWLRDILVARGGEWLVGGRMTVADLKVYVWTESLGRGILDHVPRDLVQQLAPQLVAHLERVRSQPAVASWYAAH
jgi:glutathione S-transferase